MKLDYSMWEVLVLQEMGIKTPWVKTKTFECNLNPYVPTPTNQ